MRRTLAVGSSFVVLAVVLASSSSACSSHEHEDEASTGSSAQALESGAPSREIVATADTTLSEPAPWRNAGAVPTLHVDGARNWVLVRFDTSAINGLMAGPVALKLNIATLSGWGSDGRQLSVHRLTQSWAEPNATWACSLDSAPLNTSVDCNGKNAWTMAPPVANQKRPWVPGPTAQATIADGQSGVVTFDVSSDLALFRAGTPNYGFLVKKTDESAFGVVDFASRETATPPRLVVTCPDEDGDSVCDPPDAASDATVVDVVTDSGRDSSPSCTPATCVASSPCVTAACSPTACVETPKPSGTNCADSACTIATCDGLGHCNGTPIVLPPPSPCQVTTCDPVLGVLTSPAPDGTACSLGGCILGATCQAGSCAGGSPLDCSSHQPCVVDACDPAIGACTHTPRPAGTTCSDSDPCNGSESCNASGVCAPGTPPNLDDGDVCTLDACSAAGGVTHVAIPGCNPTPVGDEAALETRASILGRTVSSDGAAITTATFTVYDERAAGAPRGDVLATIGSDGSFKLKLAAFPDAEPARSPPHRLIVVIDSPGTIRAYREGYAHVGSLLDIGEVRLIPRDPLVTNIGPAGGTATDSQGLVQLVVPAGALATTVPIQITPLRQRADFPAPLPESTLTMYGVEFEPSGTTFATPATMRVANYRNLPTSLSIPVGTYDAIENRWVHDGMASWDGSRFTAAVSHFSTKDINATQVGDLLLVTTRQPAANGGALSCGKGSSWRVGGGSIEQAFALPGIQIRGEDLSLSLHYASGLAGSRKLGAAPDPAAAAAPSVVPRGSLAVSAPGVKVTATCVPAGSAAASGTQPGTCVSVGGKCGLGGGAATSMQGTITMLGAQLAELRSLAAQATEAEFGGWVEMPLAAPDKIAETSLVTQRIQVKNDALSSCAVGGGLFGVADPVAPRVQLTGVESGAMMTATRKVLVQHRFSSPFGAGWAVREVSRLYADGDFAELVAGDGAEEEFRPRATVRSTPIGLAEIAFGRDLRTGEVFAAIEPGRIARLDPATGAATNIVTGAAFSAGDFPSVQALAVAYVGGTRHFVVATNDALVDVEPGGARRVLAPRTGSTGFFAQASVAAQGDVVFYTDGNDATPLVYRVNLSDAVPVLAPLSATTGDVRLQPAAPVSSVQFGGPRGLAIAQDGGLLVADYRRSVVYSIEPSASGVVDGTSHVRVVLGMGAGTYAPAVGERQPALAYPINQPARLAVAEDGMVLVMTTYGVTSFDPVAREAELLFVDRNEVLVNDGAFAYAPPRNELTVSFGSSGLTSSFVALTGTSMFGRALNQSSGPSAVRGDVEPLASTQDPTRILRRLPGASGGFELTDTTAAKVWVFDADGRMSAQRKRTGELDFAIEYTAPRTGRIARVVDVVGGAHVFGYSGAKLSTVTDPAGRVTHLNVDARGDLTSIVEPDGETHAFSYDGHRMLTKTSPRGDVTSYTYAPDGTVATSTKPGGETYSFEPSLAAAPSYDAAGSSIRTGAFTDAHGVRHTFKTDVFGGIDEETYTADGVTRTVAAVHPNELVSADGSGVAPRRNVFRRVSHRTVNGLPLSPPLEFDTLGRPTRQARTGQPTIHQWDYAPDGWLVESFSGPAGAAQRIERDAAGHILRILDVQPQSGGSLPSGREVSFTRRSDGQPATMTEHGITTTFTYDDAGSRNLIGSVDTLGRAITLGYDAYGNVTATSDGTASASFVFDQGNRLRTSRDALGNETTFRSENVACGCSEQDEVTGVHTPDLPAGVEWAMTYGAQGRLASVTDPQGFTERYTYEPTGEVKTVTDRLSRTTTMSHDALGRLLAMVDTSGRRHGRSYSLPTAGGWQGPTLTAAGADGTTASTSLATPLRDGDYQIGVNALQTAGFPAQISFYRDATFALGYSHYFDVAQRLTARVDRTAETSDSAAVPSPMDSGTVVRAQYSYDLRTSAPILTSVSSPIFGTAGNALSNTPYNLEYDAVSTTGFGGGLEAPATYGYTRDAGGRVTQQSTKFAGEVPTFSAFYSYFPDGRLASMSDADGGESIADRTVSGELISSFAGIGQHHFTYDARGLLATQTDFDGTYRYTYDELGRNKRLEFPDGHARVQVYDDLGRIISRCYEYSDSSLNRCYGAEYDPVGNPRRLVDPEGSDLYEYDALDRLTKVTRKDPGGLTVSVEDYAFNALGALKTNASLPVDHRRPRLDGAGVADAAVPTTLDAQPVTLNAGGQVTALRGLGLTWDAVGELTNVDVPIPNAPARFAYDSFGRRISSFGAGVGSSGFHLYEGTNRIAVMNKSGIFPEGQLQFTFLYDGVDHPLRLARADITRTPNPSPPSVATTVLYRAKPVAFAYYELDLGGNIRRLRSPGGEDRGGYRYSAYGQTLEDSVQYVLPPPHEDRERTIDLPGQPLRWKGMWRFQVAGTELYDARARMWSPALGSFLSVDEFAFHDAKGTLWSWPHQNPTRYRDPSGRIGTGDSPSSDRAIGANADWSSPAFQSTYNPAVEAGIGGFILANAPTLGFLLLAGMQIESDKDLWKIPLLGGLPRAAAAGEAGAAGESCPASSSFGPNTAGAAQRVPTVLQTGGRTVGRGTAKELNEFAGENLSRRDWGRALEAMKREQGLPNDHHGRILDNGDYTDQAGNVIDNLLNYTP